MSRRLSELRAGFDIADFFNLTNKKVSPEIGLSEMIFDPASNVYRLTYIQDVFFAQKTINPRCFG